MEPLAINSFTITKSLFYEGMLRVSRESYGKFARKALLVLAGLWLVLLVITLVADGNIFQTLGYLAVMAFAGIWICVIMPRNNAKRAFAKLTAQSGVLERTTCFYEDHLQITAENSITTIEYLQVSQILTSKRLLILTCEDKRGILLLLNGFSVGDAQTIRSLIEQNKRKEQDYD